MIDTAIRQHPFIELYDVTPETADFLTTFFGIAPPAGESEPLVLPAIRRRLTWQSYTCFLATTADRLLRHSYADGALELMSPREFERENSKAVLRRFLHALTLAKKEPVVTLGAVTLASSSMCLGIESDEAFSFARRIADFPLYLDVARAPLPDLVIEVGRLEHAESQARVSPVDVDRVDVLARLGIHEVWFVDCGRVQILHNHHQSLVPSDRSRFLPTVTGPMISRHLRNRFRIDENACITEFVTEALTT